MSTKGPAVVTKPKRAVSKKAAVAAPVIKLGAAAAAPVNAKEHGKLCECVDCFETNREHTKEISCPEINCHKTVRICVDVECEAKRVVTDKWSYQLHGEKCEEIDPEPIPCDDDEEKL